MRFISRVYGRKSYQPPSSSTGYSYHSSFQITPKRLKWVPNHEKTRWFLVLQVSRPPEDNLNKLLRVCNRVANESGHPTLYVEAEPQNASFPRKYTRVRGNSLRNGRVPPRRLIDEHTANRKDVVDCTSHFHISIAWTLAPPSPSVESVLESLDITKLQQLHLQVTAIKAKIGNAVTVYSLLDKQGEARGIIGL